MVSMFINNNRNRNQGIDSNRRRYKIMINKATSSINTADRLRDIIAYTPDEILHKVRQLTGEYLSKIYNQREISSLTFRGIQQLSASQFEVQAKVTSQYTGTPVYYVITIIAY